MLNQSSIFSIAKKREISCWLKQLEAAAPRLDLPKVRDRNVLLDPKLETRVKHSGWKEKRFAVSAPIFRQLEKFSRDRNISLASILLSAWQILLSRYANQEKITLCYVDCQSENTTDCTYQAIDGVMAGDKTVRDSIRENEAQLSYKSCYSILELNQAIANSSFEGQDLTDNSLFQIAFGFNAKENVSESKLSKELGRELKLDITYVDERLTGSLIYSSYLDRAAIDRIAANYQVLLQSMTDDSAPIGDLPSISSQERQQVLFGWNNTQNEASLTSLHQMFEKQADKDSAAMAIACGTSELTYGELNQKANQLAHYLRIKGIVVGSLVGLCIERSPEMVIAVLAILKAGGAYVPLDISNPQARIAFILEDTQAQILVTQSSLSSQLPIASKQTIYLDRDWQAIARQSQDNLDLNISQTDLAHIVYTSGSTGKPKGVMLSHGNLSHYADSLQSVLDITPNDVYLHRGSIALIVSARQLLMPLAQGATAVIVTKEETKDPIELFALIKRRGVTIVDHVPSFWRNFWGILNQQNKRFRNELLDNQVRLVAAGGEQVTPEIYQCWRQIFRSDVKLANIYGQTEGTGVVTIYQIPQTLDRRFKSLPVGSPIPNMNVYLLDAKLEPVPIGIVAEIHISGAGVAQGYLNRSELTAAKFVPNPYVPGERLYKTGDLGRFLGDGSIQFLGRSDRQVNIQGLRIELGEIEAVLSQSDLVREAAVVVNRNNLGETLVAYIVPSINEQPTGEVLRHYLKTKLPSYMIPNTFYLVKEFPQTTSGKVDRRALTALNPVGSTAIAPRDRQEAETVRLLQSILGVETVGIKDNFIELGGNSLLAARLVAEIEREYGLKLPLSKVFQAATPESLAKLIRREEIAAYPPSFVPIKPGNDRPMLFAIHNLGYGMEFYRPLAQHLSEQIGLYGLSSSFDDSPNRPHFRDIANSAAYYARDIQQIQPQGPYNLLAVSFGGIIAYEVAQILIAQGQEVNFLGLLDSYCPAADASYQQPSIKERTLGHLHQIRYKGINHIYKRVRWRAGATLDNIRYGLYQIDWLRENLVDRTSRSFAQTQYLKERKEHRQVNRGYQIAPYPGKVTLFRATEDVNPKLGWQKLAQSGLSIHDIPGEHLEILQEPMVGMLADKIQAELQVG